MMFLKLDFFLIEKRIHIYDLYYHINNILKNKKICSFFGLGGTLKLVY
jgi:hypothetical protein